MSELFSKEKPEAVGLESQAVKKFMDRILSVNMTLHGVLLVKNGKIVAEANWAPFHNDELHRMYSVSKSFVSMAVGCLIEEEKLHLEDKIYRFFLDIVPPNLHPYLKETTVRDLLMMATPHSDQSYTVKDSDWAWTFFNTVPSHPSGTIFSYDTAGTVILSTIVERITKMSYADYLKEKLFKPIQASSGITCVKTPEGTSWGGSGLLLSLYDLAKSAYVCMHHGRWGDRQLLPSQYIDEAVSKQIDNSVLGSDGYGYQIWILPQNGFAFLGMGGQYAYCFPEKDLLFACTADTQSDPVDHSDKLRDAIYELLLSIKETCKNENCNDNLSEYDFFSPYKDLNLLPLQGSRGSSWVSRVDGLWYNMEPNPMGLRRICLKFSEDGGIFEYVNSRGKKKIEFGMCSYCQGSFPELYFDHQIGVIGKRPYRYLASASWIEEHKLYIRVCIADTYFGGLRIEISFKNNLVAVRMTKTAEWFLEDYQGFAGGMAVQFPHD